MWKNVPYQRMIKNPLKNTDPDADANEFQNLISFSLSTDKSLVKYYAKLRSVVFTQSCYQTDRQTNEQTSKRP